jgi:hypothetical protein
LSPPFYKRRVREDYSQPRPAGEWLLLCIKTKKSERGVSCVKKALLKVLSTKYLTFTISTTSIHSAKAREKSLLFVIGNPPRCEQESVNKTFDPFSIIEKSSNNMDSHFLGHIKYDLNIFNNQINKA